MGCGKNVNMLFKYKFTEEFGDMHETIKVLENALNVKFDIRVTSDEYYFGELNPQYGFPVFEYPQNNEPRNLLEISLDKSGNVKAYDVEIGKGVDFYVLQDGFVRADSAHDASCGTWEFFLMEQCRGSLYYIEDKGKFMEYHKMDKELCRAIGASDFILYSEDTQHYHQNILSEVEDFSEIGVYSMDDYLRLAKETYNTSIYDIEGVVSETIYVNEYDKPEIYNVFLLGKMTE